jgi:hypothetical protein
MPSKRLPQARKVLRQATVVSGVLTALLLASSVSNGFDESGAWIVRKKTQEVPWAMISQEDVERGSTVPPDTSVLFYLPEGFERITRQVLFGHTGDTARYWGYCLPKNYDPEIVAKRTGLPGVMFLSEAERDVREEDERRHKPEYSIFKLPSREDLASEGMKQKGKIRHQMEIFTPDLFCYIMTDTALSIGLDQDQDLLNTKRELDARTDPNKFDTDGDGIGDGVEVIYHTDPLRRDSDGDNLIDGLEDKNHNGKMDIGESNPRKLDTDNDGLCDGSCRLKIGSQKIYYGEDNNLNGELDEHETSPVLRDTNGDGVTDFQAFFNCLGGVEEFCI